MALLEIHNLTKTFGDVLAVNDVSLDINSGEFITLLGPSGSGKTTVLRMIAGFEKPDSGKILLNGKDISTKPPYERDVNTVFQDYALFGHMDVITNIEYGLRVKKSLKNAAACEGIRSSRPSKTFWVREQKTESTFWWPKTTRGTCPRACDRAKNFAPR